MSSTPITTEREDETGPAGEIIRDGLLNKIDAWQRSGRLSQDEAAMMRHALRSPTPTGAGEAEKLAAKIDSAFKVASNPDHYVPVAGLLGKEWQAVVAALRRAQPPQPSGDVKELVERLKQEIDAEHPFSDSCDAAAASFQAAKFGIIKNTERAGEKVDMERIWRRSFQAALYNYLEAGDNPITRLLGELNSRIARLVEALEKVADDRDETGFGETRLARIATAALSTGAGEGKL